MGINSNKRSLTLDLQKPKAVEIVKRLVKTADIVWENFRPGIMERFRARLRGAEEHQPAPHLLRRLGLWPERAEARHCRV